MDTQTVTAPCRGLKHRDEGQKKNKTPSGPQMPKGYECTAAPTGVITDLPFTDEKGDPAQSLRNTALMRSSPL